MLVCVDGNNPAGATASEGWLLVSDVAMGVLAEMLAELLVEAGVDLGGMACKAAEGRGV